MSLVRACTSISQLRRGLDHGFPTVRWCTSGRLINSSTCPRPTIAASGICEGLEGLEGLRLEGLRLRKASRQRAKGKGQRAKGKRQKAKGQEYHMCPRVGQVGMPLIRDSASHAMPVRCHSAQPLEGAPPGPRVALGPHRVSFPRLSATCHSLMIPPQLPAALLLNPSIPGSQSPILPILSAQTPPSISHQVMHTYPQEQIIRTQPPKQMVCTLSIPN